MSEENQMEPQQDYQQQQQQQQHEQHQQLTMDTHPVDLSYEQVMGHMNAPLNDPTQQQSQEQQQQQQHMAAMMQYQEQQQQVQQQQQAHPQIMMHHHPEDIHHPHPHSQIQISDQVVNPMQPHPQQTFETDPMNTQGLTPQQHEQQPSNEGHVEHQHLNYHTVMEGTEAAHIANLDTSQQQHEGHPHLGLVQHDTHTTMDQMQHMPIPIMQQPQMYQQPQQQVVQNIDAQAQQAQVQQVQDIPQAYLDDANANVNQEHQHVQYMMVQQDQQPIPYDPNHHAMPPLAAVGQQVPEPPPQQQHPQQQQQLIPEPQEEEWTWYDYFRVLQTHHANTGSCNVPIGTNPPLEKFIREQREMYQKEMKGFQTELSSDRRVLLDALDFVWLEEQSVSLDANAQMQESDVEQQQELEMTQQQQQQSQEVNDAMFDTQPQESGKDNDGNVQAQHAKDGATETVENAHVHELHHPVDPQHVHADFEQTPMEQLQHDMTSTAAAAMEEVNIGTVEDFNERLQQLQAFKDVNGHCNIPYDYINDSMPNIAKWAIDQRRFYHEGHLTGDRVDALLTMGFDFYITEGSDLKIPSFDERIAQLQEYDRLQRNIPRDAGPGFRGLGEWLYQQKLSMQRFANGQPSSLTQERYQFLYECGVDPTSLVTEAEHVAQMTQEGGDASQGEKEEDSDRTSKWDDKYNELKEFKLQFGHTNVARRSKRDPGKDPLGEWVHFQRRQHRNLLTGKNSTLSMVRKKSLDFLGIKWVRGSPGPSTTTRTGQIYSTDIQTAVEEQVKRLAAVETMDEWNEKCEEFRLFREANGHGRVPRHFRQNPLLGRWVQRQRDVCILWRQCLEHDPNYDINHPDNLPVGMTKEMYDRLMELGFEIEVDSSQDIDPSTGQPYADNNQVEIPTIEEEGDLMEVFVGYDTLPVTQTSEIENQGHGEMPSLEDTQANAIHESSKLVLPESLLPNTLPTKEIEAHSDQNNVGTDPQVLNESEVNAVLDGKEGQMSSANSNFPQETMPSVDGQPGMMEAEVTQLPLRKLTAKVKISWEERVLELIQFKLRKNHCNVPNKWKPNPHLADWVWRQRVHYRRYKQGLPSVLTADRICQLHDLGFEFILYDQQGQPIDTENFGNNEIEKLQPKKDTKKSVKSAPKSRFKEGKWLESLAKVVKYKEEYGNCNVPRKWKIDPTLGEWVHFQRRQFRLRQLGRRNHMTDERIRKLEAVGFEWSRNASSTPAFVRIYESLKEIPEEGAALQAQLVGTEVAHSIANLDANQHANAIAAAVNEAAIEEQHQHHEQHSIEDVNQLSHDIVQGLDPQNYHLTHEQYQEMEHGQYDQPTQFSQQPSTEVEYQQQQQHQLEEITE